MKNFKFKGLIFLAFVFGCFFILSNNVKADVLSVEDVFNIISDGTTINIPSIDVEYFATEDYCNEAGYPDTESCTRDVTMMLVKAYINNKLYYIREDNPEILYFVDHCDSKDSCAIFIQKQDGAGNPQDTRTFDINYNGDFNQTKYDYVKSFTDNIKKEYHLFDLSYINEVNNYLHGVNRILDDIHVLRIYPELKEIIENNPRLELMVGLIGAGGVLHYDGNNGSIFVSYDGVIYGASMDIIFRVDRYVFISEDIEDTNEAVAQAVKTRVTNFINDPSREITVTYNEDNTNLLFDEEFTSPIVSEEVSNFVNNRLNLSDSADVVGMYDLYIDLPTGDGMGVGTTENIVVVRFPNKVLDGLNVTIQSFDFESGILMFTGSSSVPLDTSITSVNVVDANYVQNAIRNEDAILVAAYDLNLYSILNKQYINSIREGVDVLIPISNDYDEETLKVYYITDDGNRGEEFTGTVVTVKNQKYVKFTTTHFSTYAILSVNAPIENNQEVINPKTFDGVSRYIIIGIVSLFVLIGMPFYINKKELI